MSNSSNFSAIQNFVCELFSDTPEVVMTPQLVGIIKSIMTNKKNVSMIQSCMIEYQVYDNETLYDVITSLENYCDCVLIEKVKEKKKVFQLIFRRWKKFRRVLDNFYFHINRINRVPLADRLLIKTILFFTCLVFYFKLFSLCLIF